MVFDGRGKIAGNHYIEYDLIFTEEGVEQDAELWWEYAVTALREALRQAGTGGRLDALAVSSQGIASVPVDGDGRPLAHAISWYDRRAEAEAEEMAACYGADYLFETTGRKPASLYFPQLLHIKRYKPELYEKARYFLMAQDYLVYRLCGRALTDYTMASGTLCFDTGKHEWIGEFFERYGVDRAKLPRLKPFGTPAGKLLPAVAAELGLSGDTVVAVGLQDQKAAALGAGIAPGLMTLSLGTASAICALSPEKKTDPSGRVFCHAFDGKQWIMENHVGSSGASLKWLRNTCFPGVSYAALDDMARQSGPGAGGVRFDPSLDAGKGNFTGLSLSAGPGDMVRAVLEGVAFAVRRRVEDQRALSPRREKNEIRVFGGGAGSALWRQILADVLGMPVVLPRTRECANLGAALCAGRALGLFSTEDEQRQFAGEGGEPTMPDPANTRIYEKLYAGILCA
jgi:xylulokinase